LRRLRDAAYLDRSVWRFWLPLVWYALPLPERRPGGEPPLVSVVIPTYNWSSVLRHAIGSALDQTYPAIEVIVVGDGCTDDSAEVVAGFDDPRVRWIGLEVNSGSQSAPNNAGIAAARGAYVAYHGHDDVWHPEHLSLVVGALERQRADFGHSRAEMIGPPESHLRVLTGSLAEGLPASVLVHRRDALGAVGGWKDYRTTVSPPDTDLCDRIVASGRPIAEVPALTVFKFNSAWRPNCYVEKPSHEQAACRARMREHPRTVVLREIVAFIRHRRRGEAAVYPEMADPPVPGVPGWTVAEWRRIRGLQ
jgi:GT2 family glycosyltransferase